MAKIKLIAFGCSNNTAESEIMAGLLKDAGHLIADSGEDVLVVSVCNVKGPSFNKGMREAAKANGKLIIAGCIPSEKIGKIRKEFPSASIVSTHNIALVCSAVERLLNGDKVEIIGKKAGKKLCLPRVRKNEVIGIIPISTGCLGSCSYCSVKAIKGDLVSYPVNEIVSEVKNCINEGCKEIWLTAQDTGCYGMDIGTDLPALLKEVCDIGGNFKIRLGMANPQFVKKYLKELVSCFKNEKMFRFLHIPIQAGSDSVLKEMNRKYSADEFASAVEEIRSNIPGISISTDIIVGFPTEKDNDFNESIRVIERIKPSVLNLNRYWAMPDTKAGRMKQLPSEVLKERSLKMVNVFKKIALEEKKKAVGKEFNILIDEKGKNNSYIGRNDSYVPVVVKGKYQLGQRVDVKIKKANPNYLVGKMAYSQK